MTQESPKKADRTVVAPGYEPVAEAFFATIADGRASGASLAIWKDGLPVVQLAAGTADRPAGTAFALDTLIPIASVTKGLASLVIARLIERGDLPSYDTPVGEVWPQFAAYGKGDVSIGDLLAHRAGLSAPREALTEEVFLDSLATADVLAAQEPLWKAGASHQYHAFTHGALTSKLVSLAGSRSLGTVFAEEIAGPLGAEAWVGLPAEFDGRVAPLVADPRPAPASAPDEADPWPQRAMDLGAGIDVVGLVFSERGRRAELPGVNGIASAPAIAKIWSAAVTPTDGTRLISAETADALRAPRSIGRPQFAGPPPYQAWGAGVMIPSHWEWYLTEYSFGHDGANGQVSFADPHHKIGFAYLTNQIGDWERGQSVVAALSRVLG
ncbi:serine hydrolase domain-containing protein [Microbacterium yannicii]|nr:serine hydrolase domain-containing protein [Microbacterium yannicii]MCO5954430.1 beta-lactamase family protein [Microbacterium yannicii]